MPGKVTMPKSKIQKIKTFDELIKLDLFGPLIAMQQVIPIMRSGGGGSIINISSGTALMHIPGMGAYAAIKEALAHLSLTASEELKDQNIQVSVVYPYITDTNFEKNTIKEHPQRWQPDDNPNLPQADSAEHVAQLIVDCIKSGKTQVFAYDWMKRSTEF